MQTFLPYCDFRQCAKVLDDKRLGKQRVEAMQILNAITGSNNGWRNHPIVKMWTGYEEALKLYCNVMIEEWVSRGFNNSMELYEVGNEEDIEYPPWLGLPELHESHSSNLIRKFPEHYRQYFPDITDDIPYLWIR